MWAISRHGFLLTLADLFCRWCALAQYQSQLAASFGPKERSLKFYNEKCNTVVVVALLRQQISV